jgi:predicted type IV restriction endonuclease
MDFADRIAELAARIPKQIEYCETEEATKNALVLPFIRALGYDVFNPTEVMPELTADYGTKKGEKVDYAIMRDGEPVILFECKRAGTNLATVHASQLYRYFSVLGSVRFGVVTNGVEYRFHSDLDAPNKMDDRPFFAFDVLNHQDRDLAELKRFSREAFNLGEILETASELKYTAALTRYLSKEFEEPSPDFVVFVARQVYTRPMTKNARAVFTPIVQKALRRFMNAEISDRLKSALEATGRAERAPETMEDVGVASEEEEKVAEGVVREDRVRGIVTTEDEIEGYFAVKSILRPEMDIRRLHMRDHKSYCNILLDDNNRKPVARMHFDREQKHLGLFDDAKREQRVPIDSIDEIYEYGDRIIAAVRRYDKQHGVPTIAVGPKRHETKSAAVSPETSYTGTKLKTVTFRGERIEVASWKDGFVAVLARLHELDGPAFRSAAAKITGRVRPYVTGDSAKLRTAERIPGSDFYAEINMGSEMIARVLLRMASEMGLEAGQLEFEVT